MEESLHAKEHHVIDDMESKKCAGTPGEMGHEVYDDVEDKHTDC